MLAPLLALLTGAWSAVAGLQDQPAGVTPATMQPGAPVPIDPCGSGSFIFTLAGRPVGRETYTVECRPDGRVTARGHTRLELPAGTSDIETTIELEPHWLPRRVTVTGTASGGRIEQTITFALDTVTLTSNGTSRRVPAPAGASLLPSNVYYALPLIIARYDTAKGGEQGIPVFPGDRVLVSRVATDRIATPEGPASFDRYVLRFGLQAVVLWFDRDGRSVAMAVPAQHFMAVREGMASIGAALERVLDGGTAAGHVAKPDYAAPPGAPYRAEEVTIRASGYALAGTLLVPAEGHAPYPAALLITGSGQQDRDEAIPIPGLERYRPFRQIAGALAAAGIAVLRVDDRGVGGSTGGETLDSATTSSFAADARREIAYLRERPEIDAHRIALVGHSEGGTIAAMVAAADPQIAAVVLMAAPAKSGAEVSLEQLRALLADDSTKSDAEKAALLARQQEAIRTVLAGGDLPGQAHLAWTREYFSYDPLPAIRRVKQPLLILQGGRDRQVLPGHAALLARAAQESGNADVTERIFPTLNHLFLPATTGAVREYSSLAVTSLGEDVIGAIRDWLVERLRVGQ
jgi:pimeloyl-ACP methyl ester carboxylesterase